MINLERVRNAMLSFEIGSEFDTATIKDIVCKSFPNDKFKESSIMPSDYCYNRVNKDKLGNNKLLNFNIFEFMGDDSYIYLGENYSYNGNIIHKPIGREERVVGKWVNGIRDIYNIL